MYGIGFKVCRLISLALIGASVANGYYEPYVDTARLSNLGQEIQRNVHQELNSYFANLNNEIYGRVHNNLNRQFSGFQQPYIPPIPPIQPFTGPNLDLSGLNNLGEQIQQSVYQGLEPVRALEITSKMKNGVGGTTIATFLPEGKKFIISNHIMYQCDGTISESDGKCSGALTPFEFKNKKDYCYYKQGYSVINNYICLGASSVSVINNDIKCFTSTGSPAMLITLDEFKKLCEGISKSVEYKYIANPNDPNRVQIPNENKHVKCTNNQPGICVFNESTVFPNNNGNIIINSSSGHSQIITN